MFSANNIQINVSYIQTQEILASTRSWIFFHSSFDALLIIEHLFWHLYQFQESDNEMVISDVDTGEFIAKKIIYD